MASFFVESDNSNSIISLVGNVDLLLKNRRATRFLKDHFRYHREGDKLIFPNTNEDINKVISRIEILCSYVSATLEFSNQVSESITNYVNEEKKFADFAQKARLIRNNHCELSDFKEFAESLEKHLSKRSLYELQLLSAYHLAFSQNACNFSVPGAGKTSVVYGAFCYLSNLPKENYKYVDKLLIISPLSAFGPWENEYEECFGVTPSVKRLNGAVSINDKKTYLYSLTPNTITLLSYASVRGLIDELIYFLKNNKVMVVLDEAHKIKNTSGGITASSILKIAEYSSSRVVLTGTPAPNGYEDLYNLYKFIWPTKKIIPFETYQLKDMSKSTSDSRVDTLLNAIEPFFIRVKKSDLHLPPAIENDPILVPMDSTQRRIYEAIESKYMNEIIHTRDVDFRSNLVKARLVRLMQAATNPRLLALPLKEFLADDQLICDFEADDQSLIADVIKYTKFGIPEKFKKIREIVSRLVANKEKVVIWAIYIKNILDLEKYLKSVGIDCRVLYGETPVSSDIDDPSVETREKIISVFNSKNSPYQVLIANPFAVSESISLHKECHNAIYMERSFNAAHFIQSKDRIHRYGLPPDVETNYYYLLSENSVDQVIHDRLLEKEKRLNHIIESMPIPLFENIGLDTGDEDIKALIATYVRRTKKI